MNEGLYKHRQCFLQPYLTREEKRDLHVQVPQFGENKKEIRENGTIKKERRVVDGDGFMDALLSVSSNLPHLTLWEVMQWFWKEVCIAAFIDEVMMSLIAGEKMVNDYKGAVGSLERLEVREGIFGFDLGYRETLEVLDIVRGAKRSYERWEMEESERKNKSRQPATGARPPKMVMGD